jgi:site-specific recombinase
MPSKQEHDLAIDDNIRRLDPALLEDTAPFYRLARAAAQRIVAEVGHAVGGWRDAARTCGLPADEIDLLGAALAKVSPRW